MMSCTTNLSHQTAFPTSASGKLSPLPGSTNYGLPIPTKLNLLKNASASTLKLLSTPSSTKAQALFGLGKLASTLKSDAGEQHNILPKDYELSQYDVVCGRGKGALKRKGNRTLHELIHSKVEEYSKAKTKLDKSILISYIYDQIGNLNGKFLKRRPNGSWCEVGDSDALAKIGHAMRVILQGKEKKRIKTTAASVDSGSTMDDEFYRMIERVTSV